MLIGTDEALDVIYGGGGDDILSGGEYDIDGGPAGPRLRGSG